MDYRQTIEYLYASAPLFQQVGAGAYKEGLQTTLALDAHLGHPHRSFKSLHVAGTNGKGSCSHTLAAILQSAGYRTGLYTSPHLVDFRERIRVDGEPVSEEYVTRFVERERAFFEPLHPSFFELTTAMAFSYFREMQVEVAVIEVGLGGRLDCTNIITPQLSIITNISLDHTQFLGDTPAKIAGEKAGIIKAGVPVVIGEATEETAPVFAAKARQEGAPIYFAEEEALLTDSRRSGSGFVYQSRRYPHLAGELGGECQRKNTATLLSAIERLNEAGWHLGEEAVRRGFANVCRLTGLRGRWEQLHQKPCVVCDTGHNTGGIEYIARQLQEQPCRRLHIVFGMAGDKEVAKVLAMLPANARYYFTQASVKRAMPAAQLRRMAAEHGLAGESYPTVGEAVQAACRQAEGEDFVFVGGSSFVVADLLSAPLPF